VKAEQPISSTLDNFINADNAFLKWTDRLKDALVGEQVLRYEENKIRTALYR
jgi:hypothetical protein